MQQQLPQANWFPYKIHQIKLLNNVSSGSLNLYPYKDKERAETFLFFFKAEALKERG